VSVVTSHVLDTALGRPAAQVSVRIDRLEPDGHSWTTLGSALTDADGRVREFSGAPDLPGGTYRVTFDTGAYFASAGRPVFFPRVEVVFRTQGTGEHCHIPLLLSPFGYSTYRGT
jgi:5-hydroxyisourate hydrolase